MPRPRLPGALARADLLTDRTALGILGISVFSLLVMVATLGNRTGNLADAFPIRLDAFGQTNRWGNPETLWRIPLLAGMLTVMNLVAAWFVSPRDRFGSRFLLGATLVVHLIAWVALIEFMF